jgi:hypothetical protein
MVTGITPGGPADRDGKLKARALSLLFFNHSQARHLETPSLLLAVPALSSAGHTGSTREPVSAEVWTIWHRP